jgi:hypothetical protein
MLKFLGVIISFTMLLLLHLNPVKLCFMLVSALDIKKREEIT